MSARLASPLRAGLAALLLFGAALLVALVLWANPRPLAFTTSDTVELAAARLLTDPLRVESLRALGLALDRQGRRGEAAPLMEFAGERSRRDTPTAVWLLQRTLEAGDFSGAMRWADALARRDLSEPSRDRLYTLMAAMAAIGEARPELIRHLAARPWWREGFLRALAAKGDPASGEAVLAALQRTEGGVEAGEGQAFLVRRLGDHDLPGLLREGAILFGRAAFAPADVTTPPPIGWSAADGQGASSSVEAGRLSVAYDGFASATLPRRIVMLGPGAWTLTFQHRTPDGEAPRLHVTLTCIEGAALGQTQSLPASVNWREESVSVRAPPTGCLAQWLLLAAEPGDRRSPSFTEFQGWRVSPTRLPVDVTPAASMTAAKTPGV